MSPSASTCFVSSIHEGRLRTPRLATWRLDAIRDGRLAWLYLVPHAVGIEEPAEAAALAGYTITEETQTLVDEQLAAACDS